MKSQTFAHLGMSQLPTSVDNMSPGHPFLRALNDLPIDPGITAHGDGPITGKTDGVVAYESAHVEGVARNSWCARAILLRVIPIPSKKYDGFFVSMSA